MCFLTEERDNVPWKPLVDDCHRKFLQRGTKGLLKHLSCVQPLDAQRRNLRGADASASVGNLLYSGVVALSATY